MRARSFVPCGALALSALLGCGDDLASVTDPAVDQSGPSLAATTSLVFRQVSSGTYHACGVTSDDRAYCWGYNFEGELGSGTRTYAATPVPVAG